jgi:hypothetical protein
MRVEPHHWQHAGVCSHSTAVYGRSVDSTFTAWVLPGRCTFSPRLANGKVRSGNALSPHRSLRYRHKVRDWWTRFGGLMVTAARAELQDILDRDASSLTSLSVFVIIASISVFYLCSQMAETTEFCKLWGCFSHT